MADLLKFHKAVNDYISYHLAECAKDMQLEILDTLLKTLDNLRLDSSTVLFAGLQKSFNYYFIKVSKVDSENKSIKTIFYKRFYL